MVARTPPIPPFVLHPALDIAALRDAFVRQRRVRIERFVCDESAAALREHLATRQDWLQAINSGEKLFELDRPTRAAMSETQRTALDDAVAGGAREGFQFRYETIRVPDGASVRDESEDPVACFADWFSRGAPRQLMREITRLTDVTYADAQATAFSPGDLLTGHDDAVDGKGRRAAYVFGLNPRWRVEWGGLLLFHGEAGRAEALVPGFNTLDLFAVPQTHSVSAVHASAPCRRYAITGWLRSQRQPD